MKIEDIHGEQLQFGSFDSPGVSESASSAVSDREDELNITPYWLQRLRRLSKPAAISLIPSLSAANALCWENKTQKEGSLTQFAVEAKKRHPDMVLLMRVGEFYEAYGLDALMLVEYAGLNPMSRKARAGCPAGNIQATLDGLTRAGLTVATAVYLSKGWAGGWEACGVTAEVRGSDIGVARGRVAPSVV